MRNDSQMIDDLLRTAMDRIGSHRQLPESTYRFQLHAGFTFRDAAAIVPYLADLGVSHVYASPYLRATPGSMHGYDVIDHCHLNPELGTMADYDVFVAALRDRKMSHIADMVPNHVGIATNDNVWWNDVLENGPASMYGKYFDINWEGSPVTDLNGRVLVPILGSMYGEELENGNLRLQYEEGAFFVCYHERKFPISPRSYSMILEHDLDSLAATGAAEQEYRSIIAACDQLPDRCEGPRIAVDRHQAKEQIKSWLAEVARGDAAVLKFVMKNVAEFNGAPGRPESFDLLDHLLRHQCFRLACWKTAPDEINYRRFFDVNTLAALAMERGDVFEATHGLILSLLAQRKISGLRIDHPDGLYDPVQYFRRLQTHYVLAVTREEAKESARFREVNWDETAPLLLDRLNQRMASTGADALGRPLYVLGEKILALDEPLPKSWAIDGTSGYEFLNMTNGLFVDPSSGEQFTKLYHAWMEDGTPFEEIVYRKKKLILEISLASELNMLAIGLKRIAQRSRYGIDYSLHGLLLALKEVIACFPVYRSYIAECGPSDMDRRYVQQAISAAIQRNPKTETSIFHFVRDTLLADPNADATDEDRAARRRFAGKFQQLTSPATAKGIEDTAFYIYNRLLSLNEVGGNPCRFGVTPDELHAFFEQRQRDWPHTMSTLSTHDTKRSEDVRARLNVLSEMPGEWDECLQRWHAMNSRHGATIDGEAAPDRNEEYALYQTLLGAWPLNEEELKSFKERVHAYMLKAMREAKVHTSWTDPNTQREAAIHAFVEAIMDPSQSGEFLGDFLKFQSRISHWGMVNSLSQTLIKLAAPGVPDTYQGTELWDFSLTDPDNRRPVDFARRARLMSELREARQKFDPLSLPETGGIKLAVHRMALRCRSEFPGLFTRGRYLPLRAGGSRGAHVFAFARLLEGHAAVVAVPRLVTRLTNDSRSWPCGREVWGDTHITLPEIAGNRELRNVFTDQRIKARDASGSLQLAAADLFGAWPVALLVS